MRVETGEYVIDYYCRYGSRLKVLQQVAKSYGLAIEKAECMLKENHEAKSFTVMRQVFNSLDSAGKY